MQIRLKDGKATWKQEWKVIDGRKIFFRSRWEFRYALYLQLLKEKGQIKGRDRGFHQSSGYDF